MRMIFSKKKRSMATCLRLMTLVEVLWPVKEHWTMTKMAT